MQWAECGGSYYENKTVFTRPIMIPAVWGYVLEKINTFTWETDEILQIFRGFFIMILSNEHREWVWNDHSTLKQHLRRCCWSYGLQCVRVNNAEDEKGEEEEASASAATRLKTRRDYPGSDTAETRDLFHPKSWCKEKNRFLPPNSAE